MSSKTQSVSNQSKWSIVRVKLAFTCTSWQILSRNSGPLMVVRYEYVSMKSEVKLQAGSLVQSYKIDSVPSWSWREEEKLIIIPKIPVLTKTWLVNCHS